MCDPTRRRARQKASGDTDFTAISAIFEIMTTLPEAAQDYFGALCVTVSDAGNRLQLTPEQMLCGLGVITAAILLCHVDARDDPAIDRLIRFGGDAINAATALRRVQLGAVGPRPDGSFGIKLDA